MLEIIFAVCMLVVFGKILGLAIRCAWGLTKVIFGVILLPILLVGFACAGLIYVALIMLIILGLIAFVGALV